MVAPFLTRIMQRDVLAAIHAHPDRYIISPAGISNFHRQMYCYTGEKKKIQSMGKGRDAQWEQI